MRGAASVPRRVRGGMAATVLALGCMAIPAVVRSQPPAADALAKAERRAAEKQRRAGKGNLIGHGGPVKAVAVDATSGRALTGSFDYAMMAWDIAAEAPRRLHRFDEHNGAINAVAFVPGSKLALAAGDDGALALWDLDQGRLAHRFEGHEGKIVGVAVSADGRWAVSASWDHTARIWDLARREPGPVLAGHQGPVNAVAFSGDGARVYSASADGTIGIWSRADGAYQRPLVRLGWGINALARLPGGQPGPGQRPGSSRGRRTRGSRGQRGDHPR